MHTEVSLCVKDSCLGLHSLALGHLWLHLHDSSQEILYYPVARFLTRLVDLPYIRFGRLVGFLFRLLIATVMLYNAQRMVYKLEVKASTEKPAEVWCWLPRIQTS